MTIKSFHEFFGTEPTQQLDEELNKYQKNKVDDMYRSGRATMDHDAVFGKGNDRIVLPMPKVDEEKITTRNANIKEHGAHTKTIIDKLKDNDYHTDDYHSGLAYHKDTPNRKMKISKVFEKLGISGDDTGIRSKSGSSMTVAQAYAADPTRAAAGDKQIVISRNKYDVAGMSTDRGWRSCMTMKSSPSCVEGGINERYIKHDIEHGTLSAYITKTGDNEIKSPIGRINIKPFSNGDHNIYRPEASTYGTMSPNTKAKFKEVIGDWSEKHYESHPGFYIKHPSLYDDDGNSVKMEKTMDISDTDVGKVKIHINSQLHQANRIGKEHAEILEYKGDYTAGTDHIENMHILTSKLMNSVPSQLKTKLAIHHLIDHADEHDGENDGFEDGYYSDHSSDDYQQQWAKSQHWNPLKHQTNIKEMPTYEAFDLHKQIDSSIKTTNNPREHQELKSFHAHLIDNVLRSSDEKLKNEIIHDVMGPHGDDHREYYRDMMEEGHGNIIGKDHPILHTTNPRTMDTILDDKDNFSDFSTKDEEVAEHIGKHADEKLAHELVHGELAHHFQSDWSVGHNGKPYSHGNGVEHAFIQGLNQNSHGEHIQHSLTSQMVLTGGHSPEQDTTLDVGRIHNYSMEQWRKGLDIHGNWVSVSTLIRDAGTIRPHQSVEASEDNTASAYANIAEHSAFKSVVQKLKNRHDTQIPEIQDAVSNNVHGLHESTRLISLRQFLMEAAPGFVVPNESKGLNRARYRMPQVKAEDITKDENLKSKETQMSTDQLIPTQGQFNWDKVKSIVSSGGKQGGVVVSSDNYVIDGHHRFLAAHALHGRVGVIKVEKTAEELIDYLKEAPYTGFKKLAEEKKPEKKEDEKKVKMKKVEPTEIITEPEEEHLLTSGDNKE